MKECLREIGFRIYLLSNIGGECYKMLSPPIKTLISSFDGVYTASAEDGFVKKPHPLVYQRFHEKFNPDGSMRVVFIDDKEKNTRASESHGMIGVRFQGTEKLIADLTKIGVIRTPVALKPLSSSSSSSLSLSSSSSNFVSSISSPVSCDSGGDDAEIEDL